MKLSRFLPILGSGLFFSGLAWLALAGPVPEGGPVAVRRVILISVDGLRGDLLKTLMDSAPATYPNFNRLRQEGASTFEARCDFDYSETLPNHIAMVTGRPVLQPAGAADTVHHGFIDNFPAAGQTLQNSGNTKIPYKASVFDVVHDNGLSTAYFFSKDRVSFLDISYNATTGATDVIGEDNGKDKIDRASSGVTGSTSSANAATDFLNDLATRPLAHFTMIHFVDPDKTGHASGWGTAAWNAAVATTDTALGRVLGWLDAHPEEKATTSIILTADHGGGTPGTAHVLATERTNYTIPMFLWGPCFRTGGDAYPYFTNRANPGANRPGQAATVLQPLRNADVANISTALLGLPVVPDSWFQPVLMDPAAQQNLLVIEAGAAGPMAKWPAAATAWRLESTVNLALPWMPVTAGITASGTDLTWSSGGGEGNRFFRLRRDL